MKELIPLKKDIIFKTKIGEITNTDLDLDYKVDGDLLKGNVLLSGSYKMTEASVIEEDFFYKIPFSVSLSKRVNKDSIKIEIDDFKYNITKDVLNVNVDLDFSCEEVIEENNNIVEEINLDNIDKEVEEINLDNKEIEETDYEIEDNIKNITTNYINNENKYYTYKVYIVKDNDNIETICNKYKVKENDLKEYNDLSEIKVGDKLIIPEVNE